MNERISTAVVWLSVFSLCAYAQFGLDPNLQEKRPIRLYQSDKSEFILEAHLGAWKLDNGLMTMSNKGKMTLGGGDVPSLNGLREFVVPFFVNDIAAGKLYIVKLDHDQNGFSWRTNAEGQNVPLKKYVVLDTSVLNVTKIEDGTRFSLNDHQILPRGRYAITMANNRYAWDFVIR